MKKNSYKINNFLFFFTCLTIIVLYFLIVYFPVLTNEFDFWHVATSTYLLNMGLIPQISPGFYILNVVISLVTNIPLIIIPYLPLGFCSLIFLFIAILRNLDFRNKNSLLIITLLLVFFTHFGNQSYLQWWMHGVGFLIILSSILLVIIRLKNPSIQKEISIILILLIFSVNYTSYKSSFFLLTFIFGMILIELILSKLLNLKNSHKNNFNLLFIIGLVVVLIFNEVFFNEFLPRIRFVAEMSSSGLEKAFFFASTQPDFLSEFYLKNPQIVQISNLFYTLFLLIPILLLSIILIYKLYKKNEFLVGEKIFISLLFASFTSLLIYNRLGIFDMAYVLFTGFISYILIFNFQKRNIKLFKLVNNKKLIFLLLFIILISNVVVSYTQLNNNYFGGNKDNCFGIYMSSAADWYTKNIVNDTFRGSNIATDVITGGFFAKDVAVKNKSVKYSPNIIDKPKMAFLLEVPINKSNFDKRTPYFFIINYRLHHLVISNWEVYKKWSKPRLNNNKNLSSVYSSGDIVIYLEN